MPDAPTLTESQWDAIARAAQAREVARVEHERAEAVLTLTVQAAGLAGDWHLDLDTRTITPRRADPPAEGTEP